MGFGGVFSGGGNDSGGGGNFSSSGGDWVRPNNQKPGKPLFSVNAKTFNIFFYTFCAVFGLALLLALISILSPYASSVSHLLGLDIPASTVERTALDTSISEATEYYTDEGDAITLEYTLTNGLTYFYEETGVRPYIYFLPEDSAMDAETLASLAEELYDDLFSDEAHFLVVFCGDSSRNYALGYYVGDDAAAVVDEQAASIFAAVLEYNYSNTSILWSVEEVLSDTFAETADRIMSTQIPEWVVLAAIIVGIAVIIGLLVCVRKRFVASREGYTRQKNRYQNAA